MENRCPQGDASKKTRGKASEIKAKQAAERSAESRALRMVHCNICGSDRHDTNYCPHHPFQVRREKVHVMHEGCCSSSTETSEFESESPVQPVFHLSLIGDIRHAIMLASRFY